VDKRRQLASTYDGIFCGCISISNVKEFEIEKPGDLVMEWRSLILRCCQPWTTVVITILFGSCMGRMTERCILVAPFTFTRVNISLMGNFLLPTVHPMVMEGFTARTKTLVMVQQKYCLI
jgi:hypothetical protein